MGQRLRALVAVPLLVASAGCGDRPEAEMAGQDESVPAVTLPSARQPNVRQGRGVLLP